MCAIYLASGNTVSALSRPSTGCVIAVLDLYVSWGLTDCLWIVPGAYHDFA